MTSVPSLISTQAHGLWSEGYDGFWKDLQDVGHWPAEQLIKKIEKIEINYNDALKRITGIRTTYLLKTGDTETKPRGVVSENMESLELTDNEVIAGAFSAVIVDGDGNESPLKRLGFYVYDSATGKISTKGPYPGSSPEAGEKVFTYLGKFTGFGGFTNKDTDFLDSILYFETV